MTQWYKVQWFQIDFFFRWKMLYVNMVNLFFLFFLCLNRKLRYHLIVNFVDFLFSISFRWFFYRSLFRFIFYIFAWFKAGRCVCYVQKKMESSGLNRNPVRLSTCYLNRIFVEFFINANLFQALISWTKIIKKCYCLNKQMNAFFLNELVDNKIDMSHVTWHFKFILCLKLKKKNSLWLYDPI